jgi:hypothetical protein
VLLIDFITIELPENTIDELQRFHHALQLCLEVIMVDDVVLTLPDSYSLWLTEEMQQRSLTFGACASAIHSFFFTSSTMVGPLSGAFRFPCPVDSWETLGLTDFDPKDVSRPLKGWHILDFIEEFIPNNTAALDKLDMLQVVVAFPFLIHNLTVLSDAGELFAFDDNLCNRKAKDL